MGGKLAVLMYHAVTDNHGQCLGADARYAVTGSQFARHLAALNDAGLRAQSVESLQPNSTANGVVAMTFDDGHASNGAAAEMLAAMSFSADFFVNPSTVGTPNYLSWNQLRDMAAAGMSIQSHGYHHRYLNELSPSEVTSELVDSKRAIEDQLGQPVTVFAPPGGRTSVGLADVAKQAGYSAVCTSSVGLWQMRRGTWHIPRLAVLNSTSDQRFERWITQDWQEMAGQRARYWLLSSAKQCLGNQGYERLRLRLLPAKRS